MVLGWPMPGISADNGSGFADRLQAWLEAQGLNHSMQVRQINIFGDGNPSNGNEDNRIDMSSPAWNHELRRPWNMGAGTIYCDGMNRGSAMIVDTREFGRLEQGLIVATSAHVLYDLERRRRFSNCEFHYMAVDSLPGYQAPVSFSQSRLGRFDPSSPRDHAIFGREDWAFLYVRDPIPGVSIAGRIPLRPYRETQVTDSQAVHYQFIAYNPGADAITISTACQVKESEPGDLGGGSWPGQLLDDCDSEGGASGGGLVASFEGGHYLVGIRSGSHWDGHRYPGTEYPDGPPAGEAWDVLSNTNFSRAIDTELIGELRSMLNELTDRSGNNTPL
jgi:hypothetical protein